VTAAVPIGHVLGVAVVLFGIGVATLLARRNVLFMLIAIEVMLNAAGLAFVAGASRWGEADGQVIFLFILTMAAAEVAVGLALVLRWSRHDDTLDADAADGMRG
jgi:NADH-quinone oxidoreductase subunit K